MSTRPGASACALLVIDVQEGVVEEAYDRDAVVGNIATLVDAARRASVPVLWIQHHDEGLVEGTPAWRIVGALAPGPDEPVVGKSYRSSFEDTRLEQVLDALGVGELVLCGAESNHCVRHTWHAALERGFDTVLVSDAHTAWHGTWGEVTVDGAAIVAEQNRNADDYRLPGRASTLVTTEQWLDGLA